MLGAIDGFHGTSRFLVEGRLGEGGMGVVHQARDVERGEIVALKTMTHLDPGSLLRFKREFRALADISHPNVVRLYELFSDGDHWFFTMELVDGCDLLTRAHSAASTAAPPSHRVRRRIARGEEVFDPILPEPIPPWNAMPSSARPRFLASDAARLRDAFRQLASGVQAIHAAGKLHRDIKPSNVLVTPEGRVVLLDFGVVGEYLPGRKAVRTDKPLVGTPAYMAPDLLYAKLGDALVNAGRSADAADAYMEAATHAPRHEATNLRRTAAEHYLKSGREERGLAVLRDVLTEVGIRYPESREAALASVVWHEARLRLSSLLPRALRVRRPQSLSPRHLARIDAAFCAAAGLSLRDPLRGTDFGLRALRLALEAAEPVRLGRALAVAAGNAAALGEAGRRRANELVRAAQRVAAQVDDPHGHALAHLVEGMAHFFLGQWRSALTKLGEADAILRTRCRAVAWELAHAEVWSCNALILSGELRQASLLIPPALDAAHARDDLFASMHLTYPACVSHIAADDVEAAWRVAQYASGTSEHGFTSAEFGAFISANSVERYKGDGRAAWERVERVTPLLDRSDLMRVAVIRTFSAYERGLSAVASATQGHDRARALRAADHFGKTLVREKVPYAPPMGHLVHACAHAARGDLARALDALDAALTLLDSADLGYLAACARYRRGQLGGGDAGQAQIDQSRRFFAAQGVVSIERCLAMSAPGFESYPDGA